MGLLATSKQMEGFPILEGMRAPGSDRDAAKPGMQPLPLPDMLRLKLQLSVSLPPFQRRPAAPAGDDARSRAAELLSQLPPFRGK